MDGHAISIKIPKLILLCTRQKLNSICHGQVKQTLRKQWLVEELVCPQRRDYGILRIAVNIIKARQILLVDIPHKFRLLTVIDFSFMQLM